MKNLKKVESSFMMASRHFESKITLELNLQKQLGRDKMK